jgi:gas vesicle protein
MAKSSILRKIAVGTAVAGAAGYVAGVLSAPSEGKKTRKKLKKTAEQNISELEKELKDLHTELGKFMDTAKKKGDKISHKGDKKFTTAINNASGAKDKLKHVISSIHEGEATDKDLAKAVEDAKHSLDHLKHFFKK